MRFVNIASGVMVKFSPSVKILATYLIARNLYWCETGILLLAKIRMDAREPLQNPDNDAGLKGVERA